ncbi:hypothetical protein IKQ21_00165 [bacterium]|nr:hypothetical protein [bacterium]
MKKGILSLIFAFLLSVCSVQAAIQMKVSAVNEFDTEKPTKTINVRVNKDTILGNYELKSGDILKSNVLEVTEPKRGKRDADFYVQPYAYVSGGVTKNIDETILGRYSKTVLSKEEIKKLPKLQIAEKAAVTVGSFYIKGLSQGVSLAKGVITNPDGNRVKSGVKQVYEDSIISYVEKGKELDIKPDDEFYFIFTIEDEEVNRPNYSYTVPAS